MADVKKIATRESYGNTLKELAAEGHDDLVVLDADLAAATKTGMFRKAHPDRHFDCGIAEANMMGVAAGLSTIGYVPFVSSFAIFAAGRAFEQIRNSVAYPHLNVKIGATHGGISVGEDGASHQCCEDFALMRSLPGMTIICPADDVEARAAVRAAYEMQGPVYLRFGRLAVPVFHDEANYHFEIGKGEQLTEGNDIAIVATGLMVNEARKAAETLAAEGIHARVINIHTIKPLDEEIVLKAAKECGKVITAEEHNVIGGLGEAVCAVQGEAIASVAVAVSSLMTVAILTLAAVCASFISPVFELPAVKTASGYLLPALFGSMALGLFASSASGNKVVKGGIKGVLPVLIIMTVLSLAARLAGYGAALGGLVGIFIIVMLPIGILTSYVLWKKGKIQVVDKEQK